MGPKPSSITRTISSSIFERVHKKASDTAQKKNILGRSRDFPSNNNNNNNNNFNNNNNNINNNNDKDNNQEKKGGEEWKGGIVKKEATKPDLVFEFQNLMTTIIKKKLPSPISARFILLRLFLFFNLLF